MMAKLKGANKTIYVLISILFVFSILLPIIYLNLNKKILPNNYIAGFYVGNLTKNQAVKLLVEKIKIPEKITLDVNGEKNEILTSEIVYGINFPKTVNRVYQDKRLINLFKKNNYPLLIEFDEKKLLELILIMTDRSTRTPKNPTVTAINGEVVVDKGTNGTKIDISKLRSQIGLSLANLEEEFIKIELQTVDVELKINQIESYKEMAQKLVGKKIELKYDDNIFVLTDLDLLSFLTPNGLSDEAIKNKIREISLNINRNPRNSVFVIQNGKVVEFASSQEGKILDEDKLLAEIKKVPDSIVIPVTKVEPKIKNEDVNNLGIKTLLSVGFSSFTGSIPNRIHNVNLAQSKFRGVLIAPEEIFSFNDTIGDISAFTGYKTAYVIKDGKTVLGDGGGVCQVSTTLFRAVLNAGLPVVERRAHAYRVGYYEKGFGPGLDATIFSPTTDFKFKNDTPGYLLIQPTIDLDNLTLKIEIYGTSDGRIAQVSKPVISSQIAPADDLYQDDPTLKTGTIKQVEHRAYGAKVTFDYKVTRKGEEIINQKFVSNYRPWQAVYLKGTGI